MLFLSVGCTVDVHDVSRGVMFIILEELRDPRSGRHLFVSM